LFHQTQGWLAVADLHFGYELSQRAAGRLVPMWGMNSIEERLRELLADYAPRQLVIVGDLVHDRAGRPRSRRADRAGSPR
jgi:metallophosphoesterase superfamily enzyme